MAQRRVAARSINSGVSSRSGPVPLTDLVACVRAEMGCLTSLRDICRLQNRISRIACGIVEQDISTVSELARLTHTVFLYPTYGQAAVQQRGISVMDWLEPIVETGAVGCGVALLSSLLDCYERVKMRPPPPPPPPQPRPQKKQPHQRLVSPQQDRQSSDRNMLTILCNVYMHLANTWETAFQKLPPGTPAHAAASLQRLRTQLVEQMADCRMLQVASRLCSLVRQEIWPLAVQHPAGGGSASGGGGAAAPTAAAAADRGAAAAAAAHSQARRSERSDSRGAPAGGPQMIGFKVAATGCTTLACITVYVWRVLYESCCFAESGNGISGAWTGLLQRFLVDLSQTGLVASISAALLEAPPCPELGAQPGVERAAEVAEYAAHLERGQLAWVDLIRAMGRCAGLANLGAAALAPLNAPEVWQLQREALRQVAAAVNQQRSDSVSSGRSNGNAPNRGSSSSSCSSSSAASDRGSRAGGAGSRSGDGSSSGSAEALLTLPVAWRWPMLQRDARGHIIKMCSCIEGAVNSVKTLFEVGGAESATRLVEQLLPSRVEAAELGAGCLAALHAALREALDAAEAEGGAQEPAGSQAAAAAVTDGEDKGAVAEAVICQAEKMMMLLLFRMCGAPEEEAAACLPGLLEMAAWRAGMSMAMLTAGKLEVGTGVMLSTFSSLLTGDLFTGKTRRSLGEVPPFNFRSPAKLWQELSAESRAAALQRLLPTCLPRSLDALLRHSVCQGGWQQGQQEGQGQSGQPGSQAGCLHVVNLSCALAELVVALADARYANLRLKQQQQQQESVGRAKLEGSHGGNSEGDSGGAGDGAASGKDSYASRWRPRDELGLVLTALKLLRRQSSLPPDSGQSRAADIVTRIGLGCFLYELGLSGLPSWLQDMRQLPPPHKGDGVRPRLVPDGGSGSRDVSGYDGSRGTGGSEGGVNGSVGGDIAGAADSGRSEGPSGHGATAEDAAVVAQAVAACGTALLPYMQQLVEEVTALLCEVPGGVSSGTSSGSSGAAGGCGTGSTQGAEDVRRTELSSEVAVAAAYTTLLAVMHLPPDLLLAAAPQRLLAALGRLLVLMEQWRAEGRCGHAIQLMSKGIYYAKGYMNSVVALLSADERLLEGCLPGWLWAEEHRAQFDLDIAHLAELYCNQSVGSGATPRGPVATLWLHGGDADLLGAADSHFGQRAEELHERRRNEVMALARAVVQRERLMEGSAWRHLQEIKAGEAAGGLKGAAGAMEASERVEAAAGALVEVSAAGAGGEGDMGMWPPRLLRLCGNPLCGNFSGCSEVGLKMPWCARCCAVRYCSVDCQRQHWPQHKPDCGRWAGRWQRDSK